MTNPTPHGQVPEALIDLIDAYAETRHRCGGIYNAKTEAARKTVIEALSGVQALSAAPADVEDAIAWLVTWKGGEHTYVHAHASELPAVTQARVMGGTVTPCVAALAASPTPPAEQQVQPGAVGRTGCTAGTDEECTRRGCATSCPAQQAAPKAAPGEPSYSEKWDAELGRTAMRFVDRAGDVHPGIDDAETICAEFHKAMSEVIERMPHVRRMTPHKAAPGELSADSLRHQNKLLAETLGACILASGIVRKDTDGFTGPELLHFGEDLRSMLEAAPQQEATKAAPGEPSAHQILAITTAYEQGVGKGHQAHESGKEIANPYDSAYGCDLAWHYGYGEGKEQAQRATKAAPQPSPAPLSESIDQVERALAIIGVVGAIDGHDVVRRESVLEIARRAAIAAQGGKDAG